MAVQVEWEAKPKSGITEIEYVDLNVKDEQEWLSLSNDEQRKRIDTALSDYETIKAVPLDWYNQ